MACSISKTMENKNKAKIGQLILDFPKIMISGSYMNQYNI